MEPKVRVPEWEDRRRLFYRAMKEQIWDYQRYSRWFRSEFSEVRYPVIKEGKIVNGDVSEINLTALVGRSFMSQLFFSSPDVIAKELPGHLTAELAKVLTTVGNDMVEKGGLFDEGSRCLQDGFLGPFMCMKVGYDADFVKDPEAHEQEVMRAEEQLRKILTGGRIKVNDKDNFKIFVDVFGAGLEAVKQGDIEIPTVDAEYLERQLDKYRTLLTERGPREFEKVKAERVWFRRQAPDAVWFNLTAPDLNSLEYMAFTTLKNREELEDNKLNTVNEETVPSGTSVESEENEYLIDERLRHYLQIDAHRQHYIQHEVLDLRNNQVVVYCQGMNKPLRVMRYGFREIMRNGAAVLGIFDEDPRLIIGLPQVKFWEKQQIDACVLNTVQLNTAKANAPGMAADKDNVDREELEQVVSSLGGRVVMMKNLDKRAAKDVITDLPAPKTTPETFAAKSEAVSFVDRLSGLGQTKLGGGDFSRTATASDIVDQAVSALMRRYAKKTDNFFLKIICFGLRIVKAFYSPQTIGQIAGPRAKEIWPTDWTPEQIVDDRGIELIVSTMREETTPIERKQMQDLLAIVLSNPMIAQVPALQKAALKLTDYLFRLHHAPIDLQQEINEIEAQMEMMQQRQEEAQAGGAGPSQKTEGVDRPADMNQPVTNVAGGGRNGGGLAG